MGFPGFNWVRDRFFNSGRRELPPIGEKGSVLELDSCLDFDVDPVGVLAFPGGLPAAYEAFGRLAEVRGLKASVIPYDAERRTQTMYRCQGPYDAVGRFRQSVALSELPFVVAEGPSKCRPI